MSKELVKVQDEQKKAILEYLKIEEPTATEHQVKSFLHVCETRRLDPVLNQINAIFRKDNKTGRKRMTFQVSVDGLRAIAARTGQYAGSDEPEILGEPKSP